MPRVLCSLWLTSLLCVASGTRAAGDDRAAELLSTARAALGGAKLEDVRTLSASGPFRRMMGEREIEGDLDIDLAPPGQIRRTEHVGIPGGPTMTRTTALDGGEFWTDTTNRGGGFMARAGQGGDGRGPSEADRERFRQMQQQRLERELRRYELVWLLRSAAPVAYAGTAQADDGTADVLEIKGAPTDVRLFLDQRTHLPLMATYEDVMPRVIFRQGRRGPPDAAELERLRAEPPQKATFELRFDDYRDVDGVKLPHRMTLAVDGKPTEEWTIERFKVNPAFKANTFAKP